MSGREHATRLDRHLEPTKMFQQPNPMKTKPILSAAVTQRSDKTLTNSIRRKWFAVALSGFLVTSIFALLPSPAQAECPQGWDLSGKWWAKQSNGSFVEFNLTQNGTELTGTARTLASNRRCPVTGFIKGNKFKVGVTWRAGSSEGVYTGTVSPYGFIEGTTYDYFSLDAHATWLREAQLQCAPIKSSAEMLKNNSASFAKPPASQSKPDLKDFSKVMPNAESAPAATPKPIKSSGKYKPSTTPSQLPVVPGSGGGTAGGFIQMFPTTPSPTPSPEAQQAAESASNDTQDQQNDAQDQHKKKKKHHHHHDDNQQSDDENQGNN